MPENLTRAGRRRRDLDLGPRVALLGLRRLRVLLRRARLKRLLRLLLLLEVLRRRRRRRRRRRWRRMIIRRSASGLGDARYAHPWCVRRHAHAAEAPWERPSRRGRAR